MKIFTKTTNLLWTAVVIATSIALKLPCSSSSFITAAAATNHDSYNNGAFEKNHKVLYINIVVVDPKNAVYRKVNRKIMLQRSQETSSAIPKPFQAVARKVASNVAAELATPDRVAHVMAKLIPKKLPHEMQRRGITGVAETVFCEAPYLVVQLQIQRVDPIVLVEARSRNIYDEDGDIGSPAIVSKSFAQRVGGLLERIFTLLGRRGKAKIEQDVLPRLLQSKLVSAMPAILAGKLEFKEFEADSEILPEAQQARFFYAKLNEIRQDKASNRPIVRLRNKIYSAMTHEQETCDNTTSATTTSQETSK